MYCVELRYHSRRPNETAMTTVATTEGRDNYGCHNQPYGLQTNLREFPLAGRESAAQIPPGFGTSKNPRNRPKELQELILERMDGDQNCGATIDKEEPQITNPRGKWTSSLRTNEDQRDE